MKTSQQNQYDKILDQKIDYWKKKLIDLSKRNNLVSYRFTKSKSTKFISPSYDNAFEHINEGKSILVFKRQSETENTRDYWEASEEDEIISKKLHNLYLKSSSNFRELGINTCFLAFGSLKYYDTEYSDTFSIAPIFLFPAQLTRTKSKSRTTHNYEINVEADEMLLNPALIEKMSSDYGLVLEKHQNEQDIHEYVEYLRKIIQNYKNWEIQYDVYLDIFSYQKFIMFEDISNNVDLVKSNPLIRAYVGDSNALLGDLQEIPREVFQDSTDIEVLPADSSQKRAIELAKAGVTFVLQGPPGTGKSQTICNMIMSLIEDNKKVLFVSQKKAALDVVLKRLTDIGMDRYCLNLHQYGGNKKEIIQQLLDELNTSPRISDKYRRYTFTKYLSDQSKINDFYYELCRKRDIRNLSIYNIRGLVAQLSNISFIISSLSNILDSGEKEYVKIIDQFENILSITKEVNDPLNNPYYFYKEENTLMKQTELIRLNQELYTNLKVIDELIESIYIETGFKFTTLTNLDKYNKLHTSFQNIENRPDFLLSQNFYSYYNEIIEVYEILSKIKESKDKILKIMDDKFLLRDISNDMVVFQNTGFFGRLFNKDYKNIKRDLNQLTSKKISHKEFIKVLKEKENYDSLNMEHNNIKNKLTYMNNHKEYSIDDLDVFGFLYKVASELKPIYDQIKEINNDFHLMILYIAKSNTITDEINDIKLTIQNINKFFSVNIFENNQLDNLHEIYDKLESNINKIDQILYFREIFEKMNKQLREFITECFKQKIGDPITKVFEKSYYIQLLDYVSKNKSLMSPKKEISNFKNLDFEVRDVKRFKIMEELEKKQPSYDLPSSGNERAILIREGEKKRRLKPIRQLLSEIPNLVFVLKPCFMMSPLTVSQYILPDSMNFDVVIFDEASQIMPEDAVPCLMRANQAIILGDTQQLPPTTFFQKSQEDDYLDEDIEDLPSFLSEASTRFRPEYLNWHYRSSNENLIAFSNYHFYKNRLITFPNANQSDKSGIEFVYVENGIYDRGKSRKNIVESEEVVELYLKLRKEYSGKSFGIVAFGISQETAIREAFERKQIELDESLNSTKEDLFIRNLETVQGDERDIIILSVGYGRDSRGILSYNFGPLNKEDGYKRLNVAITRSRFKTLVVCSFHPEEMVEEKISSSIRYFKNYLEFAKHKDFDKFVTSVGMGFDSEFEEAIYDALIEEGYDVSSQVGCSGYRVDLAIKHPEKPGEYILGIECDGAQYHSSRYARDRDKVRQNVLERLGWNIHRIWSDDWIKDQTGELNKIKEKVNILGSLKKNKIKITKPEVNFTPVENKKVEKVKFNSKFESYEKCSYRILGWNLEEYTVRGRKRITYDLRINDAFSNILSIEGPMDKELLFIRVGQVIDKKRGTRIKKIINKTFSDLKRKKVIYENGSTVHNAPIPELVKIRISNEKDRKFIYIPKEEIASAIVEILKHNFTSDIDSLKKDVSQGIYNFKRLGPHVDKKINEAITYLIKNKIIQLEAGKISLINEHIKNKRSIKHSGNKEKTGTEKAKSSLSWLKNKKSKLI